MAEAVKRLWDISQNEGLKELLNAATKLDGSSGTGDFCVVFERLFKGMEGDYGIPFRDRDYEH